MGAADAVAGGIRRAVRGVRSALPGSTGEPAADEPGSDATASDVIASDVIASDATASDVTASEVTAPSAAAADETATSVDAAALGATLVATAPARDEHLYPPAPVPLTPAAATTGARPAPVRSRASARSVPTSAPAPAPPEAPPAFTDEELASFRAALEAEVARLRSELRTGEVDLADLVADAADGTGDDQADTGSKRLEREQEMSVNANLRDLLDQTLRALRRLDAGAYGVCETCGTQIRAGRLRAYPRATKCITCKQAEERR